MRNKWIKKLKLVGKCLRSNYFLIKQKEFALFDLAVAVILGKIRAIQLTYDAGENAKKTWQNLPKHLTQLHHEANFVNG